MQNTKQEFADNYGDTLTVQTHDYAVDKVYIQTQEGEGDNQANTDLAYDKEVAIDLARHILAVTGADEDADDNGIIEVEVEDPLERIALALEVIAAAQSVKGLSTVIDAFKSGDLVGTVKDRVEDVAPEVATVEAEDVEEGQTVTFLYQGEDDTFPRQRKVEVEDYERGYIYDYVVGYDLDDGSDYKRFRTDRIHGDVIVVEDAE